MAQSGYPWTLDLRVVYDLSADGLTVTQSATNLTDAPAPYAQRSAPVPRGRRRAGRRLGADPAGGHPARCVDDRLLPVGREDVERDAVRLPDRAAGPRRRVQRRVHRPGARRRRRRRRSLVDRPGRRHRAWRCGSTSGTAGCRSTAPTTSPATARRSLAVEPMTAQADAFRSGEDLVVLAPRRADGDEFSVPGASGRSTSSAARSAARRGRAAGAPRVRARSPSEPWMPIAATVVPSARSRVTHGAPGGRCTATTSAHSYSRRR